MAPEQATFNNLDIDTRSDVYSLGTLLYELLAGSPPFAQQELEKRGLLEILRVVREEEPQRPSLKLSTAEARASISANRSSEPAQLSSMMKGEIDWIVMKALEKDRARRYDTATALAKDVQRYLNGDAVEACPPTLGYRMRKAYRRNRTAVRVVGMFVGLCLAAVGIGAYLAVRAMEAERQAKADRDGAELKRVEAEWNAKLAEYHRDLFADSVDGHIQALTDADCYAKDLKVDLDLLELERDPKLGLLRLSQTLNRENFDGWYEIKRGERTGDKRLEEMRRAGDEYHSKTGKDFSIPMDHSGRLAGSPSDMKLHELQRFLKVAVITTGQSYAPLLPPLSHRGPSISTQKLSRDGRSVLTLDEDGTARFLDLKTSEIKSIFREKDEVVLVTDFSPDGPM